MRKNIMMEQSWTIAVEGWRVAGQMSPYLLFGFLMAGLLSVFVSPAWVERHLGRGRIGPVIKSVLFGIPLPLCSCSVLPVTASLRNHGASRGATVGFLLATPQTGVDSILATWGTLGPVFGVFRPLVALVTGISGGLLTLLLDTVPETPVLSKANDCVKACCADKTAQPRWWRAMRYGFYTLPKDIGPALLAGMLVAGAISALVPAGSLAAWLGGGIGSILLLMLMGIPIYVCSTASIPLAIGFMHMGASPGAALAFLIAGPATNAATIIAVWHMLGKTSALIYITTVAAGAVLSGLLLDAIFGWMDASVLEQVLHVHCQGLSPLAHISTVVLLGIFVWSMLYERFFTPVAVEPPAEDLESMVLSVSGMTCEHCRGRVSSSLAAMPGVSHVEVDLGQGKAVVWGHDLKESSLVACLQKNGYQGTSGNSFTS